jgi:hypothetical protein
LIVPRAGAPHGRHSLGVPGFARQAALMNDFGRCTAMAEAETTDHAAMASLMARAEQLLTALAHLGPPLPHLPVLSRVAPNGPPRRQFSSANSANSVKSVSLTCSKLFLSVPELGRWWLKRGRDVGGKTYSVPTYSGRAREAQNRDFRMLRWCTRRRGIETTHLWQHPWHPLCPCQTAQGLILNPASAVSSRYSVPNYMTYAPRLVPRRGSPLQF